MVVWCIFLSLVRIILCDQEATKKNVWAQPGTNIVLSINYTLKSTSWSYRNATDIYYATLTFQNNTCTPSNFLKDNENFRVDCNVTYMSVTIQNVKDAQNGDEWIATDVSTNRKKIVFNIYVYVFPEFVYLVETYTGRVSHDGIGENKTIIIQCFSAYSRPSPNITLYGSKQEWNEKVNTQSSNCTNDVNGTLFSAKCTYELILKRSINAWTLYCNATNFHGYEVSSDKQLYLDILYPPDGPPVLVDYENSTEMSVIENKEVSLVCRVSNSNPPANLTWNCSDSGNGNSVSKPDNNTSKLTWVAKRLINTRCVCFSAYKSTHTKTALMINTLYPARFTSLLINETNGHLDKKKLNILERSTTTIRMVAEGNPDPFIYWQEKNITGPNLTLSVINRNQTNSVYIVSAENWMNTSTSTPSLIIANHSFELNILYPPKIKPLSNISVIEGNRTSVTCKVTFGNPVNVSVVWMERNINEVDFVIDYVLRSDEQWYTCKVNNTMKTSTGIKEYGTVTDKFYLSVLYPPKNISLYSNLTANHDVVDQIRVIEGTITDVVCKAEAKPTPRSFMWTGAFSSTNHVLVVTGDRLLSRLITCHVENLMTETPKNNSVIGKAEKQFGIDVLYPPKLSVRSELTFLEGENISITCVAVLGRTTYQHVSWNSTYCKNGTNSSELNFKMVNRNKSGIYACQVNYTLTPTFGGSVERLESKTSHIEILYKPEQLETRLVFGRYNSVIDTTDIVLLENTSFTMNCSAQGNPSPTKYVWRRGAWTNYSNIFTCTSSRKLLGKVTCEAFNFMNLTNGGIINGSISQHYNIDALYPPEVIVPGEMSFLEGDTIYVICIAKQGKTTYQLVSWKSKYSINRTESSQLIIPNVNRTDAGLYTCQVNYTFNLTFSGLEERSEDKIATLKILYPPEQLKTRLVIESKEYIVNQSVFKLKEGTSFIMNCSAHGNPTPTTYMWRGTWNNVSNILTATTNRSVLGHVTCEVFNVMRLTNETTINGSIFQDYIIETLYAPDVKRSRNVTQFEGDIVLIDCLTDDGKTSSINYCWRFSNQTLNCNGPISIQNVSFNDSGIYRCEVNYTLIPTFGEEVHGTRTLTLHLQVDPPQSSKIKQNVGDNTGTAVGAAIGGVALIVIVSVVVVFIMKRRTLPKEDTTHTKHHEYQNMAFVHDTKQDKRLPALPPPEEDCIAEEQNQTSKKDTLISSEENTYLNTMDLLDRIRAVNIAELLSYVANKTQTDFFEEYERLPKGLIASIPCSVARRPENAALNRYQGVYPYDHSRVIILGQPDFFINANYINGFKSCRYIASLGPTVRHTLGFVSFWQMVWHEQSDVIVMLTNLTEPSGMKCEKYWAEAGTSREIGDFTIQSRKEDVTAEYTVRTLTCSKDDEHRLVTQLHFTAWPDKTVPASVTSLIEFRQRVKAAPTLSKGPLIVHCSAGIGRTGTYIALDRLIEEGSHTDSVNIFDCVMNMRKQRVNMVQTPDQYVYLHQALVYCLVFDIEPVTDESINDYVKSTSNNTFSQIFQQLKQTVEFPSQEEEEARSRNTRLVDMNRRRSDIPGDLHRVRVHLDKESEESDYINAVYFDGFIRLDQFIIAQSPLPKTVEDFVRMLYQEKVACIVSLDDREEKGTIYEEFIPGEHQQSVHGYVTISCLSKEEKSSYVIRKLKLCCAGKYESGERIAYQLEFTGWKCDETVPRDPKVFVDYVLEMAKYDCQLADEKSHVLVHCKTASERSGLFCAVSNLVQKMKLERQVSVPNVLRQLRARRKTVIPTMEQLKFCYLALGAFVKSYK